jgi:dynein heavy chain
VLRDSKGNILDDEQAIDALHESQQLAQEIKQKQEVAKATYLQLDLARKGYAPIAHHCSLLFFLAAKLVRLDAMYQYSLSWFLRLFNLALEGLAGKFGDNREMGGQASENEAPESKGSH